MRHFRIPVFLSRCTISCCSHVTRFGGIFVLQGEVTASATRVVPKIFRIFSGAEFTARFPLLSSCNDSKTEGVNNLSDGLSRKTLEAQPGKSVASLEFHACNYARETEKRKKPRHRLENLEILACDPSRCQDEAVKKKNRAEQRT